ncbi:hypothetical protein ASZ90_018328 [hydrocarbon metagenome]|uniref:Uncharacterized protein n=1 Tax=hydrocarbon metagenome TaxID=938273 RepID=A0A0W8E7D3_9ZZZZ
MNQRLKNLFQTSTPMIPFVSDTVINAHRNPQQGSSASGQYCFLIVFQNFVIYIIPG